MCCQCPARLPRHAQPPRCPALPRVGRAGAPRDLRPSGDTPRKTSWWCAGSEGLSPGVTALPHITLFAEGQQPRRLSLVPGGGCGRQGQTRGVRGQQHVCAGDSSTCVLGDSGMCVRGTAACFGGQQPVLGHSSTRVLSTQLSTAQSSTHCAPEQTRSPRGCAANLPELGSLIVLLNINGLVIS